MSEVLNGLGPNIKDHHTSKNEDIEAFFMVVPPFCGSCSSKLKNL